ncbi:Voltage-gated potassium channel Kch [Thiomonas bhubaneswarensis]|uniref:Voltage-gated potassium channel Kch n=2 Tax=Thiomonas bhubaneswarensis TaxID=339866 RepID=A0A0K6HZP0_9BURK|nr:Voltage-gated potassium channel Kch [Thiomonas bhubaneswarensis]
MQNRQSSTKLAPRTLEGWRGYWYRVMYFHDKRDEKLFDLVLIGFILFSVLITVLDSVQAVHAHAHGALYVLEWIFTLAFTVEYVLRLSVVQNPWRYARSFFGIIDLLSFLPAYLELLFLGSGHLTVIRTLRVLRIFRILKLMEYTSASNQMLDALSRSKSKIFVFVLSVLTLTTIFGSIMYLVEGPQNGFTSIPRGIYWAIVTMATVGFGDITPKTALGQIITSGIIIVGYGIIAVPTGIYSAELVNSYRNQRRLEEHREAQTKNSVTCVRCGLVGHTSDARYCRRCGEALPGVSAAVHPEAAFPDSSDHADRARV